MTRCRSVRGTSHRRRLEKDAGLKRRIIHRGQTRGQTLIPYWTVKPAGKAIAVQSLPARNRQIEKMMVTFSPKTFSESTSQLCVRWE